MSDERTCAASKIRNKLTLSAPAKVTASGRRPWMHAVTASPVESLPGLGALEEVLPL
jgi:hypothetical protein